MGSEEWKELLTAHLNIYNDEHYMRAALQWAALGKGWNSPRPSVGCVVVANGQIIGGGHTQSGDGNPHAEVMAMRAARQDFPHLIRGATAYVTLEPCSHWGTTPPCCDLLIKEEIARVVVGVCDPNPLVSGRGFERMRAAGIEIQSGVLERECRRAHDDFLKHIVAQRPFVTLKCAASLDGQIALQSGESKWISNETSRRRAHILRHEHDAILTGIGTVLADDPQLSVRLEGHWKQPARVVLDAGGRTPLNARLWNKGPQVLIATNQKIESPAAEKLEEAGATVLKLPAKNGQIEWNPLLDELYARGIYSVLIEGGSRVAGSALRDGIVDKIVWFVAPILLGEGRGALANFRLEKLAQAPRLQDVEIENLDGDAMISGYLEW